MTKRANHEHGGHDHQRGHHVECADAALDEAARTASRSGDRDRCGITANDKRLREEGTFLMKP